MALKTTNVRGNDVKELVDRIYAEIHQEEEKLIMYFVSAAPYVFCRCVEKTGR